VIRPFSDAPAPWSRLMELYLFIVVAAAPMGVMLDRI
jgi:hypothetical protein